MKFFVTHQNPDSILKDINSIFARVAKTEFPLKLKLIEDGKEIEKQFGTIDEYPKDKEPSIV